MDFHGNTVLVTGGSRGIGRAVCQAFAARGARVAINYRSNESAARDTMDTLAGEGHMLARADISDPAAVERLIDRVTSELGALTILVNNAGGVPNHSFEDVDYAGWQKAWHDTLALNLIGAANASYCAGRFMMKNGGGRIVSVSSRGAFRGEPEKPAYGASKAGLNAMSQSLAQKLARYNIFVGVVAPGYVETDLARSALDGPKGDGIRAQSPLGRVAKPEEVAMAVLFLAAEGTEFTTGTIIDVNGASYLRS